MLNSPLHDQTLAFCCDDTGKITSLLLDPQGFLGSSSQPVALRDVMSPEEHCRYLSFLDVVRTNFFSLEKDIVLRKENPALQFTLMGVRGKEQAYIIAIQASSHILVIYDELMRILNEQGRMLREAQQQACHKRTSIETSDILEDYLRINNELVDMKRMVERQNRQLQQAATTDVLTGVANRRHLFDVLEAEIAKVNRYEAPLAVIMLDIDHFKVVNDTYGHAVGDELLAEVAALIQQMVRDVDLVGRYGGEEFVVVMPNTSAKGACLLAERIRAAMDERVFVKNKLRATISAGIAECGLHTPVSLLDEADGRLYQAKEAGRNRVMCV